MPPLGRVVIGFLLVMLDVRIEALDLLPDAVGWVVVLAGLVPLSARSRGFGAAAVAAGVGLLLALVALVSLPGPVLGTLEAIAETVVVFGTCTGIRALVADPRARRTADRIRWADLAITGVGTALGLTVGETTVEGAAVGPLLVLVLAGLGVVVWFLVFLWSNRRRPELAAGLWTGDAPEPGTP